MPPRPERILFAVRLERKTEVLIEDSFLTIVGTTRPAMGYHISVLGPAIIAHQDAFDQGIQRASTLLKDYLPLYTVLNTIGTFRDGDISTPYLGIADPSPYIALHNDLLETFAEAVTPESEQFRAWTIDQYMPHVTLGLGLSEAEMREFTQRTQSIKLNVGFISSTLSLLRQRQGSVWENDLELPLQSETGES